MTKGTLSLAQINYTRDDDGQVTANTEKGLPNEEKHTYTYDENNRLVKAGGAHEWEYDDANNPTKIGTRSYAYNAADELETRSSYTYNEEGALTKTTPTKAAATTYGYDQAGNLTSVSRPEEGGTKGISDTYTYDGNGLRASQANSEGTKYMAWDVAERIPQILSDGQNSYIYGPNGIPIEQINSEGKALYLHHDQQGSTRLLTGSTGIVEGAMTYDPYGNQIASSGTKTTPLGYDGQYTNTDTGLIYLRAREYDPATDQFITADPIEGLTLAPYYYVNDNPLNYNDPSGLIFGISGTPSTSEIASTAESAVESAASSAASALNTAGKAIASVAHYAAPVADVTATGVCVVFSDGACGVALAGNFFAQQALAADQAIYTPNYQLGLNEAVIFAGAGLGVTGLSAVGFSGLEGLGRVALAGSISFPQLLLNAAELLSPDLSEQVLACN